MSYIKYERSCIEIVIILEDNGGVFWEDSFGAVTMSAAIHQYLWDNDPDYKSISKLNDAGVVSHRELLRIRHNSWRKHKRKLAKEGKRLSRVYQQEFELL